MFKISLFTFLLVALSACSSNKYVGKTSNTYAGHSCSIEQETCNISYGEDGYLTYSVTETAPNTYTVSGKVDLNMNVVGGMRPKLSFYVIFMDDTIVQHEKRVKTGTRKATFEFEVTTKKPISKTTIEKMLFHTWS